MTIRRSETSQQETDDIASGKWFRDQLDYSFEVVVQRTIGTVVVGDRGTFTPYQAAINIIGNEGEPGVYRFPLPGGNGTCQVTIEHLDQQEEQ